MKDTFSTPYSASLSQDKPAAKIAYRIGTFTAHLTLTSGVNNNALVAPDTAGNIGRLTAKVTYTPVTLTVTSPAAGATLSGNRVQVSGTFQGPGNTGITVNGVMAEQSGTRFFANDVPLIAGNNTLTVKATLSNGALATRAITVFSDGIPSPFHAVADPATGVAPLRVSFSVENISEDPLRSFSIDYQGDRRVAHKDVEARWTKKNGQNHYGYKNHVKVDRDPQPVLHPEQDHCARRKSKRMKTARNSAQGINTGESPFVAVNSHHNPVKTLRRPSPGRKLGFIEVPL